MSERPGEGYWPQLGAWCLRFVREPLAGIALLNDVIHLLHRGWPVEACSEGLGDYFAAASVVPASAFVYVKNDASAILVCNAPLEDADDTSLVNLTVYYGEGL